MTWYFNHTCGLLRVEFASVICLCYLKKEYLKCFQVWKPDHIAFCLRPHRFLSTPQHVLHKKLVGCYRGCQVSHVLTPSGGTTFFTPWFIHT